MELLSNNAEVVLEDFCEMLSEKEDQLSKDILHKFTQKEFDFDLDLMLLSYNDEMITPIARGFINVDKKLYRDKFIENFKSYLNKFDGLNNETSQQIKNKLELGEIDLELDYYIRSLYLEKNDETYLLFSREYLGFVVDSNETYCSVLNLLKNDDNDKIINDLLNLLNIERIIPDNVPDFEEMVDKIDPRYYENFMDCVHYIVDKFIQS